MHINFIKFIPLNNWETFVLIGGKQMVWIRLAGMMPTQDTFLFFSATI